MPDGPPRGPGRALDDQMVADWAAVGLRRLETHLALHAAFCDFLRRQSRDEDDREESCPQRHER